MSLEIVPARTAEDFEAVRHLFRVYQAWLDEPVCFDGFEGELAGLPGRYAPPDGELLIGRVGSDVVGLVGIQPLNGIVGACEIKRLYVCDSWRGNGFGRSLAEAALDWAARAGYRSVGLETFEKLTAARDIYRRMGFVDRPSRDRNDLKSPIFMECTLV